MPFFWLFDSPGLNNIVFHQKQRTSASHGGANARKGTEASCGGTKVDVAVVACDGHTDMWRWRQGFCLFFLLLKMFSFWAILGH
ncbi:hypothetical protein ES332_D04G181200v1 [Gossypium tomentosum]|uniref:Uncharacterized protein n=1 Tax=Gossypium tomentosum TaxID=34277 RepID=A0A5D2LI35_GOSTO|nr:hypothetical protein ES332_D04G181200v1 [Gossypium tomentosum]